LNNQNFYLGGDFLLNDPGTFINTSSSLFKFNGSAAQTYSPNGILTLHNVEISNTGAGVTLNNDLILNSTGVLTLTNGIFNTGNNKIIVTNNAASAVSGGSSTSYINGYLRRYINTNTDEYLFPLGDNSRYALFTLLNNNLTGTSYLTGHFTSSFTNSGSLNPNIAQDGGTPYLSICTEGIWQIDPDVQPSGGNYGVKLWFNDGGGANPFAGLTDNEFGPLKRPSSSTLASDWSGEPIGSIPPAGQPGRMVSDGYAKRTNITSFSQFSIGKSGTPLPIFLSSINASCNNGNITIQWSVESEMNIAYYDVTKSMDAIHFSSIGIVSSQGNSNERTVYEFQDHDNPKNKNVYYQIKQVNLDGSIEKYPIISTMCQDNFNENDVIINQTGNNLTITLFIPSGTYKTAIFDNIGRKISETTLYSSFPGQTFILNNNLTPGIYNIVVYSDNLSISKKIVIGK
jgi:hypothetical protein